MGMSQNRLAQLMGIGRMCISEIVRGRRAISAETALRLGKVLGTGARFWINLQTTHDLAVAARKLGIAV
jgi:addiction module HigA family antidote